MTEKKDDNYPIELTLHFNRPLLSDMIKIESFEDAYHFFRERIEDGYLNHKEHLWIILLTKTNRVLGFKEESSGMSHATLVPLREIAQICLLANAGACILIHNHPSGNLKPSAYDLEVTKKASHLFKVIEVSLLDHLIITQEGYFSFCEEDLLEPP